MIEAVGQGGQMRFDGHYLTITRNGFLARATHGRGDKNIPFTKKQQPAFETLRAALEQAIASQHAPAAPAPAVADELGKLAELHQQGVLSDQEFAAQKQRLLGS